MVFGPWENKELYKKYSDLGYHDGHVKADGSHDYKFKYMRTDVGPSVAPWHKFPTANKPHPYCEYPDPYHFEMYPRKDLSFVAYWQQLWAINRTVQSRGWRHMGNSSLFAVIFLALYLASMGAHGSHEDHSRDYVIDLPRRF